VNAVVPVDRLEQTTTALAADIASASPLVHRIMKEELRVLSNAHPLTPEAYERSRRFARGLRQRRLPGRHPRVSGEAPPRLPRQLKEKPSIREIGSRAWLRGGA